MQLKLSSLVHQIRPATSGDTSGQRFPRFEKLLLKVGIWLGLAILLPSFLEAQGCAMCRTTAAVQAAGALQALNLGIVVLLVPPVMLMSAILYIAFREDT